MRKTSVVMAAVLLTVALVSCNSLKVRMGESSDFNLLPLSSVDSPLDSYQLVTGSFPGYEDIAVEAWLVWDERSLELMLFAPTGQTMGKIFYDGKNLKFETAFMPEYRIIGLYMVADMQLCFSSSEALSRELAQDGMILVEGFEGGRLARRSVFENGVQIYEITYSSNVISVSNKLRGYSYTIETL